MRNLTVYQRFAMIIAALTMVLFAVVANEVKALSSQTAKATDVITGSIAVAVEEQGAATREVARSVHQAAQGAQGVMQNITGVREASSQVDAAAPSS